MPTTRTAVATKKMGAWRGADTWYDEEKDELHIGNNGAGKLYTYDPTENGIDSFSFPFKTSSNRGCLSQWWAGSEPVCAMLAAFLGTNDSMGFPYYNSFGFKFRPNVKRMIFVFSNEFDNPVTKTYK